MFKLPGHFRTKYTVYLVNLTTAVKLDEHRLLPSIGIGNGLYPKRNFLALFNGNVRFLIGNVPRSTLDTLLMFLDKGIDNFIDQTLNVKEKCFHW